MKPIFQKLWNAFPDHVQYLNMKSLYEMLGGAAEKNIYKDGFGPNGNSCASRLSVAFNKADTPIDLEIARIIGVETLGSADGYRIIFRVADFRKYLLKVLGKPAIDKTKPYDDAFRGKRGIIAFSVNWGNATGHIALWNGITYREPSHDNYASFVNAARPSIRVSLGEFWELTP